MKRFILCIGIVLLCSACEFLQYNEPEDTGYRTERNTTPGDNNTTGNNNTGTTQGNNTTGTTNTSGKPGSPYAVYYDEHGVCWITAYIGYQWDSYKFWPRHDGQYGNNKVSILQFPASGGDVIFEIVNMYTYFSLYITNYNKYEAAAVYYFDEDNGFPGVLSFSQYGTEYERVYYHLIVKENVTSRPVSEFCQAHWTANYAKQALSEFHIQCRQLAAGDHSSNQVILIDY